MEDSRECPLVEATAAPSLAWLGPGPMLDCMQVYFLFHGYRHGPLYLSLLASTDTVGHADIHETVTFPVPVATGINESQRLERNCRLLMACSLQVAGLSVPSEI